MHRVYCHLKEKLGAGQNARTAGHSKGLNAIAADRVQRISIRSGLGRTLYPGKATILSFQWRARYIELLPGLVQAVSFEHATNSDWRCLYTIRQDGEWIHQRILCLMLIIMPCQILN